MRHSVSNKTAQRAKYLRLAVAAAAMLTMVILAWLYRDELKSGLVDDTQYAAEIREAAAKHQLDPQLVRALIFVESGFDSGSTGAAGEVGLMQILPSGAVAEWARVKKLPAPSRAELFKIKTNLDIGCWFLHRAMVRWEDYDHGLELALAQYNAGAKRAKSWSPESLSDEVIDRITIRSTRNYVKRIIRRYEKYRSADAGAEKH